MPQPSDQPRPRDRRPGAVHVMAKPTGALCNLDCTYCYYLEKEKLYPSGVSARRMSDETLELHVRQYIEAHDHEPEIDFAWQGGEPTPMGLDFYRRAVALQERYAHGKKIRNSLHVDAPMRVMAGEIARGRPAAGVMRWMRRQDGLERMRAAGRNEPCPCGSGKKFKQCHGRST